MVTAARKIRRQTWEERKETYGKKRIQYRITKLIVSSRILLKTIKYCTGAIQIKRSVVTIHVNQIRQKKKDCSGDPCTLDNNAEEKKDGSDRDHDNDEVGSRNRQNYATRNALDFWKNQIAKEEMENDKSTTPQKRFCQQITTDDNVGNEEEKRNLETDNIKQVRRQRDSLYYFSSSFVRSSAGLLRVRVLVYNLPLRGLSIP